ncbi:hypothetical protein DQ04_05121050 [Trypanosoma grayi]|uniref:hypothetical protein n=1 Tax=Trypanosoma grayi TaxID=71804 RepID=UPI0004F49D63|nr:hypothetical protein DQ04_05121050 [Trypanosoma grayi]KEG09497.1 hypothetical protein DQ04_05121050 [Trypanosoma grayi]
MTPTMRHVMCVRSDVSSIIMTMREKESREIPEKYDADPIKAMTPGSAHTLFPNRTPMSLPPVAPINSDGMTVPHEMNIPPA